jgi:hypothetical protein
MRDAQATPEQVVLGSFAFSTDGLGLTPGNPLSLIQASESADEASQLARWFDQQWTALRAQPDTRAALIQTLQAMGEHRDPFTLYTLILHHLFRDSGNEMDEERIVKSATGIRNTVVWKKLFKFQRDGVVGAIDKLNRFGGCIIADSVGLGKTFEALAIIKYHELRNDRVLVAHRSTGMLEALESAQDLGASFSVCGERVICVIKNVSAEGATYAEAALRALLIHKIQSKES